MLGIVAVLMWLDARDSRSVSQTSGEAPAAVTAGSQADHNVALPLNSFAGVVPENADALAKAHAAYDAKLPAVATGDLVQVHMTLKNMIVEVALTTSTSSLRASGI